MCLSLKLSNLFVEKMKYLVHTNVVSRNEISDSIVFTACLIPSIACSFCEKGISEVFFESQC